MIEEIKEYVKAGEEIMEYVANDSTILKSIARVYCKLYDELTEEGNFKHEDAMAIITSLKFGK